ncbi:hypothetical protein K501DRAFT_267869 [Backusella circina FSU 941]|nr:hypothetical protein K501DRAFT_267869 [Backusella circina FSU 941]
MFFLESTQKLNQLLKSNVVRKAMARIVGDDDLLGSTPVNITTLKENPEVYIQFMQNFLYTIEMSQTGSQPKHITDKCDKAWLKLPLHEFDDIKSYLVESDN